MTRSVGTFLRAQREKRKLTLDDVYQSIKIHPKYLKALEQDDYSVFDGKVHAKGFLRVYSDYLGLSINEVMALWRREYEPHFEGAKTGKAAGSKFLGMKTLENPKFMLTPGFVISVVSALAVIIFFGYLFFQYRSYTGNPMLEIFYPEPNKMVESDLVDVTGKTELDSEVFINNQKVILNQTGNFAVSIKLKEGINTLSIVAVNKLGKKTEDIRTVIYRAEKLKEIPVVEEGKESTQSTPTIPTDALE